MKQLIGIIITIVAILGWLGSSSAWDERRAGGGDEPQSWSWEAGRSTRADSSGSVPEAENTDRRAKDSSAEKSEKRFCTNGQETELLELLKELKNPASVKRGRLRSESEVRRKYRIARKLRQFDDCRAEDALKELIKENACEDLGEGDIFCVKWGASASLQEVESKKDLKKLTPDTALAEQLKVIKKYGPHPHNNEFASHAVMQFLIGQSAANPKVYVPLLVEYFVSCHDIVPVARKYPEATDIGIKRCIYSSKPTLVWAAVNLARTLNKVLFFPEIYSVAFAKKGPLDYSRREDIEEIQTIAISFFRQDEMAAIPYYRGVLYGDFRKGREYVISGIKDLTNPQLLRLLQEFSSSLENNPDLVSDLSAGRLRKLVTRMTEVQK